MHECIAIGCSHTENVGLPPSCRWMNYVYQQSGMRFTNLGIMGAGIIHLLTFLENNDFSRCSEAEDHQELLDKNNVKWVVLQKPSSIRHPWRNNRYQYDYYFHMKDYKRDDIDSRWSKILKSDSIRSASKFKKLRGKNKIKVAAKIYETEKLCIQHIKNMFPNAKFAYYHYFMEYLYDQNSARSELSNNNIKLGVFAESIGMYNMGMIINRLKKVPGALDRKGNPLIDFRKLAKHGYILNDKDYHPGIKYQKMVAQEVVRWLRLMGENT